MKGLILLFSLLLLSPGAALSQAVQTVTYVDLGRYVGTWYEIAKLPNSFQRDCLATKAQYDLRDDGKVAVTNTCRSKSRPGKEIQARGLGKVVDAATNAKLKVTFTPIFGFLFAGDYWILELDQDYRYALVGTPDRDNLWILSRTPTLEEGVVSDLKNSARNMGFDVENLRPTPEWR